MHDALHALKKLIESDDRLSNHPALAAIVEVLDEQSEDRREQDKAKVKELVHFLHNHPDKESGISSVEVCDRLSADHVVLAQREGVVYWKYRKGVSGGFLYLSGRGTLWLDIDQASS